MQLIAEFEREHLLIDEVAGSLFRLSAGADRTPLTTEDVLDFVRFLRVFVAGFHHRREEETLFTALVEHAEVPARRGPIAVLTREHHEFAAAVDELEAAAADPRRAAGLAGRIAHHLWEHLDKENSVLLPEAEQRLIRGGIRNLDGRRESAEETAAREVGEDLVVRIPPLDDPDLVRGDGCIACSAFTVTCGGIEKEWWNTWETEWRRSLDEG